MARKRSVRWHRPPSFVPSIAAVPLWGAARRERTQLLTEEERARLSVIASIVRFARGMQIYRAGDRADAVFNIVDGVVKTYHSSPDGAEHITAFLFAEDLLGLAERGHFVNSARAVTPVTAYRLPAAVLEGWLRRDAALDFHIICKLCHDLREAQRHAVIAGYRSALAKLAMFLQALESRQARAGEEPGALDLPMSRSDIAAYVGLSLEAVSRAFRTLAARGAISIGDKRHIRILDRAQLAAIAAVDGAPPRGRRRSLGRTAP